jgi:membrane associated rhomboid family serine protease
MRVLVAGREAGVDVDATVRPPPRQRRGSVESPTRPDKEPCLLILPLHRAITRANFPLITFGLILANAFVFLFLQSGDDGVRERAVEYYASADLAQWEFPAYREWLGARADAQERTQLFSHFADAGNVAIAVQVLQSDADFVADLEADRIVNAAIPGHAQWRELRSEFDRLWEGGFTERWMLRQSELSPRRMFGAMFLHGGIGHLLGNMLFLALLGLLVEGALGHGLFLVVYLVGGFGAALASLAWHWGDHGSLIGASGAIASLMGAYCVLWGRRRVRFFWWFFVVFDYVRAPALLLLPFWLGWELLQLLFVHGSNVAFEAHAGGIVSGALLALAIRLCGRERREFLDEDEIADAAIDDRAALGKALEHVGRLELPAARALLEPLAQRRPDDLDILAALYRCARYEPGTPQLAAAAAAVFAHPARSAADARVQKDVYDDALKAAGGRVVPTPAQQLALAARWPLIGEGGAAARLLGELAVRSPALPHLPAALLGLARDLRARGDAAGATRLLERVVASWPESIDAGKARVLLADPG